MKKTFSMIAFVVIAVGLVWLGIWYDGKMAAQSAQSAVEAGAAAAQAQQALVNEIKITDLTVGTGTTAVAGDTVTVNYVGTLDNGTKFDSSFDRNQPYTFQLGAGKVIPGWDLGVPGMKVGGKRTLVIPPDLAYGAQGYGPVPGNATLHFTVELLAVSTSSASTTGQ